MKTAIIGHKGMCGVELLKLLNFTPIILDRTTNLDFKGIDLLFMAINSKDTIDIAKKALKEGVKIIDLSSAFRTDPALPLILPTVNGNLINNSLNVISLPNCVVSILLTALAPLEKISPITKMILSTYQAASGAGKAGLKALETEEKIDPFPYPLRNNLFLHESEKLENGLCKEEEKIIFETRKILNRPNLPISVRCVRLGIKRAHSIHAVVSFEQKIHNIKELLSLSPFIELHPSPNPFIAEGSNKIFVAEVREDTICKNTYDFWISGDQLLRGAALNAFEAYNLLLNSLCFSR